MRFFILHLCILWLSSGTYGFGVEIEGLIDLGPKWNYKYKFSPINNPHFITKSPEQNLYNSMKIKKDMELKINDQKKLVYGNRQNKKSTSEERHKDDNELAKLKHKLDGVRIISIRKDSKEMGKINSNENMHNKTKSDELTELSQVSTAQKNTKENLRHINTFNNLTYGEKFELPQNEITEKSSRGQRKLKAIRSPLKKKLKTKVENDLKLHNFTKHVFKKSLKIFDNIQTLSTLDKLKNKIKLLKKSYIKKFNCFFKRNKGYRMKTNIATKKFIMNTIDTSYNVLIRLSKRLNKFVKRDEVLRTSSSAANVFEHEVIREKKIEYEYACKKFNVCRNHEDFSDFIAEVMTITLQATDVKIRQAANALTESVQKSDFDNFNDEVKMTLNSLIKAVELSDLYFIKDIFLIFRNVIVKKNVPIVIMNKVDSDLATRTVAFHESLDILDKNILKSENNNSKVWEDFKNDLHEWKDGFRADIVDIFDKILYNIKNGCKNMDQTIKQQLNKLLNTIIKPLNKMK